MNRTERRQLTALGGDMKTLLRDMNAHAATRRTPNRLGDAIRQITEQMHANGVERCEIGVRHGGMTSIFELRYMRTTNVWHGSRDGKPVVLGGALLVDTEAFGPAPVEGARQMAESKQEQ